MNMYICSMAYLLHIETSSNCCSVALSEDAVLKGVLEEVQPNTHASSLPLFIQDLLNENGLSTKDLSAVAVGMGPGSYTGLRVGLSLAKGICMVNEIPLIALSSLQIMAKGMRENYPTHLGDFVPLVDARRMEVYTAQYDQNLNAIKNEYSLIVNEQHWSELPFPCLFGGSGASKVKQLLGESENLIFDCETLFNSARFMPELAFDKLQKKQFADLAYAEPAYLKEWGQL